MVGLILKREGVLILGFIIYFIIFIVKLVINRKKLSLLFFKNQFNKFILVMYFLLIFGVTLCPLRIPFKWSSVIPLVPVVNMNPLNILTYRYNYYSIINIVGNIILLAPLPILMVLNGYEKFKQIKNVILFCFLLTVAIELCQYLEARVGLVYSPRATDILDIIFNTLGGVIGYISYKIYRKKVKNDIEKLEK